MNLIWFRNDLRVLDNPALSAAVKNAEAVRAVFFITEKQWIKHDWGEHKIGFVLNHVLILKKNLAEIGIPLDIINAENFSKTQTKLESYAKKIKATALFFNKEYEINELRRDEKISKIFKKIGVEVHTYDDQTIVAPGQILTKQKTPYTVFTPFKRSVEAWLSGQDLSLKSKPRKVAKNSKKIFHDFPKQFEKYLSLPVESEWKLGEKAALSALKSFCNKRLLTYKEDRDFPDLEGTSKLSPYLAAGILSAKYCYHQALKAYASHKSSKIHANIDCWMSELIWRDFYKHIIFHFPKVCLHKNFNASYDRVKWRNDTSSFNKWKEGRTGLPIIDAAMRQLLETGWMHNRLRMVVAMFLTKNLLIDWRKGESFFARHLIDLDFASNNGGWQWSSSTGTDAAPYFRVFNPVSQSEKFDPEGNFIKTYCPELKGLGPKEIHNPSAYLSPLELKSLPYPEIIVDLKSSRERAIKAFKK